MRSRTFLKLLTPTSAPRPARRLCLELLDDRCLPSTFTVLNQADSGSGSLRAAVLAAEANPGADLIRFAPHVSGTITLTTGELLISTDLTIAGPGAHRLTVSGNDASRAFRVLGGTGEPGAITVGISDLTVAHGRAAEGGGIISSGFSDLTLARMVLSDNVAIGLPGSEALGGAVHSTGSGSALTVVDSLVVGNAADGRVHALRAGGGGLSVQGGRLRVASTTVADNRAVSGSTIVSGAGGGMTVVRGASAVVSNSVIRDNRAVGGVGGGPGHGGGIFVNVSSSLAVGHSVLTRNQAFGGNGGLGRGQAYGGAIDVGLGSRASISDSILTDNRALAGSGGFNAVSDLITGTALGGAISTGVISPGGSFLEVTRSLLSGNQAIGGNNATHTGPNIADVGSAHGGAVYNARGSEAVIRDSAVLHNKAVGGDGNTGNAPVGFVGTATGGGIDNSTAVPVAGGPSRPATLTVINSTVAGNEAVGGDGNTGGEHVLMGAGLGGGVANYLGATASITGSLLTLNEAAGGDGGLGAGGGVFNGLGNYSTTFGLLAPCVVNVAESVVALNRARGGRGNPAGDGLGGGVYNDATSSLTLFESTVTKNCAIGRQSGGEGIGGGLYNLGTFAVDAFTVISKNHARASDDDVFDLG